MNKPYEIVHSMKLCEDYEMPSRGEALPMIGRDMIAYKQCVGTANLYHIYISDEIIDPFEYVTMIKTINMASDTDQFIIHLNTPGGDIYTAIQLCNAITMSPASFTAYIEGCCASAGTMIALACDGWVMNPLSTFMVHAPTLGNYGKFNEVKASSDYIESWTKKLFETVYEGFLTKEEMIQCMENNKDYWFGYDEFMKRIHKVADLRTARVKASKEGKDPMSITVDSLTTEPAKEDSKETTPVETPKERTPRIRKPRTSKKVPEVDNVEE